MYAWRLSSRIELSVCRLDPKIQYCSSGWLQQVLYQTFEHPEMVGSFTGSYRCVVLFINIADIIREFTSKGVCFFFFLNVTPQT